MRWHAHGVQGSSEAYQQQSAHDLSRRLVDQLINITDHERLQFGSERGDNRLDKR
jgi:hypothetical protein